MSESPGAKARKGKGSEAMMVGVHYIGKEIYLSINEKTLFVFFADIFENVSVFFDSS